MTGINSVKRSVNGKSNGHSFRRKSSGGGGGDGGPSSSGYSSSSMSKKKSKRKLSLSSWEQSNSVELLVYANPLLVVKYIFSFPATTLLSFIYFITWVSRFYPFSDGILLLVFTLFSSVWLTLV